MWLAAGPTEAWPTIGGPCCGFLPARLDALDRLHLRAEGRLLPAVVLFGAQG